MGIKKCIRQIQAEAIQVTNDNKAQVLELIGASAKIIELSDLLYYNDDEDYKDAVYAIQHSGNFFIIVSIGDYVCVQSDTCRVFVMSELIFNKYFKLV